MLGVKLKKGEEEFGFVVIHASLKKKRGPLGSSDGWCYKKLICRFH